jgi:hypothetical protein
MPKIDAMAGDEPTSGETGAATRFAHPVEREFARLLDAHGIEWLYEPHTFVLERAEDGHVREAFTPDFYLPDLDLYVECTVMRQRLTNRKRRKVLRARHQEGVAVEILYRHDLDRLARRWRLRRLQRAVPSRPPSV